MTKTAEWQKALEWILSNEKMLWDKGVGVSEARMMCPHKGFAQAWVDYRDEKMDPLWNGRSKPAATYDRPICLGPKDWRRIEEEMIRYGCRDKEVNVLEIARVISDRGHRCNIHCVKEVIAMWFGKDAVEQYEDAAL